MKTIRMNEALNNLLRRTAEHLDLSEIEVIRATAVMIRNGNAGSVEQIEIHEMLYAEAGNIIKNYRIKWPEIDDAGFRRILAGRCLAELAKPKNPYFRSFAREAGILTRPPATLEEAEAAKCIVEEE